MVQTKLESQDLGRKRRQDTCVSIRQHRKVQLLQGMNVNPSTIETGTEIHVGNYHLPGKETIQAGSKAAEEMNHLASTSSSVGKLEIARV